MTSGDPGKPPISPRTLSMIFNSGDFSKLLHSRDSMNNSKPSALAAAAASAAAAVGGGGVAGAVNPFESTDSTASIFRSADFLRSMEAYKESMSKAAGEAANQDPAAFFRSADFLKSLDNLPQDRRKSVFRSIDFLQSLDYSSTDGQKLSKDIFASMEGKKFGKDIFSSLEGKKIGTAFAASAAGDAGAAAAAAAHKKQLKDILSSRDWGREYNPTGATFNRSLFESQDSVSSVSSVKSVSKMGKPLPPKKAGLVEYYNSANSSDWMANYKSGHVELPYDRTIFRSSDSFKGEKPDPPAFGASPSARAASPTRAASPVPAAAKKPASSSSKWMKMYQAGLNNSTPASITIPPAGLPPSLSNLHGAAGLPTTFTNLPASISIPPAAPKPAPTSIPAVAAMPPLSTSPTPTLSPCASPTPMDGVTTTAGAAVIGEDGKPKKPKKKRIYKSRKVIPEVKTYVEYTDDDVLLGRGGLSNKHPGNKRYRQEIENAKAVYRSASKDEKTEWANLLVEYVKKYGGRFLEKDKENGKWYIVPDVVARRKAGQALREDNTPESRKEKRDRYKKAHGKL